MLITKQFQLPKALILSLPCDYAKNVDPVGVKILAESVPDRLIIRWTEDRIDFIGPPGGVSYDRSRIQSFHIFRNRRVMSWRTTELTVKLPDCFSPIIYCMHDVDSACTDFDTIITALKAANLPIPIEEQPSSSPRT